MTRTESSAPRLLHPGDAVSLTLHACVTWRERLLGVYRIGTLGTQEGVWLWPCRAVHTLGVRQMLDVVFLDSADHIVRVQPQLPPNRCAWHGRARSVVELAAGFCQRHSDYADQITAQIRNIRTRLGG